MRASSRQSGGKSEIRRLHLESWNSVVTGGEAGDSAKNEEDDVIVSGRQVSFFFSYYRVPQHGNISV